MEHISIERNQQEKDFFEVLQEESLAQLQELSGNVWTDYNLHDPGVTILEQLNYALWEFDYRLGFDIQDYLTSGDSFDPKQSMLFPPDEVFTTVPVTPKDYRLLILSSVENVSDVKVIVNKEACSYDFVLDAYPDTLDSQKQDVIAQVERIFHANRNLCEILNQVVFSQSIDIQLHADVEIGMDALAEQLLADIYYRTQTFLSSGVSFLSVKEEMAQGRGVDEIFEGPTQRKMVDPTSLTPQGETLVVANLYSAIQAIDGVRKVFTLYFSDGNNRFVDKLSMPDLYHSYVVKSFGAGSTFVNLWRNGQKISVDAHEVNKLIQNYRFMRVDSSASDGKNRSSCGLEGKNHGVFSHLPLAYGLPDCYGVNERGLLPSLSTPATVRKTAQLKVYLSWLDELFEAGLDKLNHVSTLVNGKEGISSGWVDLVENLYGENSKLAGLNFHGTRRPDARLRFVNYLATYGKERGKAMNLLDASCDNFSGVENYLKLLLGIDEHHFDFFLVEHPLFAYAQSVDIPEEDKFTVSVLFFASDLLLQDKHFCNCCLFLLQKRLPAHLSIRYVKWFPFSTREAFKADLDFWKYMLSTQRKLGADVLSSKLMAWLKSGAKVFSF